MARRTPWIRPDNDINDLTAPTAAVDMNGQEIQNHVLHKVADSTARDALVAVKGKLAYQNDTDAAYICTSIA